MNEFRAQPQRIQVDYEYMQIGEGGGRSNPPSYPPHGGVEWGSNALLYLNSHNSDKKSESRE
jgi:hypothetical protein